MYKIIGYDDLDDTENYSSLITYGVLYSKYIDEYNRLSAALQDIESEIDDLKALGSGDSELANYYAELNNAEAELNILNSENREFNNGTTPYEDTEMNIAVYVEDYAGNMASYKTGVSRNVLLNSNLIDFETELLDNSTFSIVKTTPYTSGDKVNLRIRSQGATHMLITTDIAISPDDISNYIAYETSNGNYEFDISVMAGPKVTIYAYYTAGEYEDGELIYVALSDSISIDKNNPTVAAPDVEVTNDLELTITVNQEDNESGIFRTWYGYMLAESDVEEDVDSYKWYNTVDELEKKIEAGRNYYIRTKVTDAAGNGPVVSNYAILRCPTEKIVATPNKPKIENMTAITWKSNLEEIEIDSTTLKDEDGITRVWYNYELANGTQDEGTSKWANAKSDDGSYWVWIPRYAYKIIYYTDSSKTEIKGYYQNSAYSNTIGYYLADGETLSTETEVKTLYGSIEIVFLYNTEDYKYYDSETKLVKSLVEGGTKQYSEYIVHPAFKAYSAGTTVNSKGNWNRELTGIWVAKFEASRSDATFLGAGTSDTIKIVPSVKGLNNIAINEAFNYALQLNTSMNSHLMKNSEWGAVAYLAYSAYGRNESDVMQNVSSDMITGAGTTSNGATYATTSETIFENRYGYKTSVGMQSSTTKNIYGVYDLVGGAAEFVSAYINNGETELATNGSLLQNANEIYMSQAYNEGATDTSLNNYTVNSGVYGDAIYEVSTSQNNIWEGNNISYPTGTTPFFVRGGSYSSTYGKTGVFDVNKSSGTADLQTGFRAVLAP